ncbi:MAG: hypothetical protein Q8O98_00150 [bacterium]|nr:hypothetical protein [bacterium]
MSKGSNTATTPTTFFGVYDGDYKADDGNGHSGTGSSRESANEALQHAQAKDVAASAYSSLGGWHDTPKSK